MPLDTGVTIDDVKNSLRISGSDDDQLLSGLISTAESYVKGAVDGSIELATYRKIQQFNAATALFAEFLYQSRGSVEAAPAQRPIEIESFIQQLRGMELPSGTTD